MNKTTKVVGLGIMMVSGYIGAVISEQLSDYLTAGLFIMVLGSFMSGVCFGKSRA